MSNEKPYIRPGVIVRNDFTIDHLLIHEASLHRATKSKNSAGGRAEKWGYVQEVTCRFTVYNPQDVERLDEQRVGYPTLYKVITRGDEDIREGDRFVFKGRTFEVLSPPLDPSFLGHHLEIQVAETDKKV